MTRDPLAIDELAEEVRVALQAADLDAYFELLDPEVSWGPPNDLTTGCHNRREVLAWYRRGRERGMRADIFETVVVRNKILIGAKVSDGSGPNDGSGELSRWQVLTVVDGRINDIRGYEDREDAVQQMR